MTKKEILKNFPTPTKMGVCETCGYVEFCDKILPGFHKPGKCGGPFTKQNLNCSKNMNKKAIRLTESDLHRIIKESMKNIVSEGYAAPTRKEERNDFIHDYLEQYNGDSYEASAEREDIANACINAIEWADRTMLNKAIIFFKETSVHGMIEENINVFIDEFCKAMEQ